MLYRHLYLTITPPSYQFPEFSLPPHSYSLQSLGFDRSSDEGLPDWVREMDDQPTVYATLGTVYQDREIFQAILDGLGGEPVNLIMTLGRNRDTTQFGPQPPNVHIEQYIPQTLLFPYCDMAITSGSYNTHTSALAHGLPLLVIPISDTQPFHALRCVDLGVGLALTRPGQYEKVLAGRRKDLSPETVREAVYQILRSPSYRQQAQRIQEEVQSLPDPETAVEFMTKLAREKTLD
jgi:MGT family glycosyltransferase